MIPPPPRSTLFPYTTLFRSLFRTPTLSQAALDRYYAKVDFREWEIAGFFPPERCVLRILRELPSGRDRKSTRLNSSHVRISYAVFCLKKKTAAWPGGC